MISNVEILYGLANRCKRYGIKNSKSNVNLNPLNKFLEICDGIDGAEIYGWHYKDLEILKCRRNFTNFTKIDILKFNPDTPKLLLEKHSSDFKNTYLKGIYIHNPIDKRIIEKCKIIIPYIKKCLNINIGFSIYDQQEIDLLRESDLKFDILQIPYNPNVDINYKELQNLGCEVYLRSIFLQGVYFSNLEGKFNQKVIEKVNYQKEVMLSKANFYGFDLGQYLFSNAVSFCEFYKFNGIIVGTSSFDRLNRYVINHQHIKIDENEFKNQFDIISDYLADPRKWKI